MLFQSRLKTAEKSDDPIFKNREQQTELRKTAQKREVGSVRKERADFPFFTQFGPPFQSAGNFPDV